MSHGGQLKLYIPYPRSGPEEKPTVNTHYYTSPKLGKARELFDKLDKGQEELEEFH